VTGVPILVGLDIGGTKVLAVAVDPTGRVLASVRLRSEPGADRVVQVATTAVTTLAHRLGVDRSAFRGVGVGVPGLVDATRGVLWHAVNLGVGSDGLALATRLQAGTGLPVSVENDVNAAAFGAFRALRLEGRDIAYLSIGTGLAAGLVLDGAVRRGARGTAGEIGHVAIDPAGPVCGCGQRGCLEALVSGSAIGRAWPVPAGSTDAGGTAGALFRAAASGDVTAARVRRQVAEHLAVAVRLLVLTVDVEVVVLGGGVAEVGEPLRAAVAGALRRQADGSPFLASLDLPARISLVPTGQPVAAIGAALLAPGDVVDPVPDSVPG
jgi:glucokinase